MQWLVMLIVLVTSVQTLASEKNSLRSYNQRFENCAKIASSEGRSCAELVVRLDVSRCGDPKKIVTAKVRCEGEQAIATYQSAKFDYRAVFAVKRSWWGGASLEIVGDISRSRRRVAIRPSTPPAPLTELPPLPPPIPTEVIVAQDPQPEEEAAEDKTDRVLAFLRDLSVKGSIDMYYLLNFNRPSDMTAVPTTAANASQNTYRVFDVYHDSFQLSYAHVLVQKPTEPVGFIFDLAYGPAMQTVSGSLTDASQMAVKQAVLSYKSEGGVLFEAGRFVTHVGYEVIEAQDNWNYSRGLLFGYLDPFWHQGVKISYQPLESLTITALWVNGWNNSYDFNTDKNLGLQFVGVISEKASVVFNFLSGQEPAAAGQSGGERKSIYDLIGTYKVSDELTLAANLAHLTFAAQTSPQSASGAALFARWEMATDWSLSPRVEVLSDPDNYALGGASSGGQTVRTYTVTLENRLTDNLAWRAEGRMDRSTKDSFVKSGSPKWYQETLSFALLGSF